MPLDLNETGLKSSGSSTWLGGYGSLTRMSKRYYDQHRAWRNISYKRQGTVAGGMTYDHIADLTYNPLKYTTLSPSRDLTKPILMGQGQAERPRVGAFTLDMIDWNSNLAQLTGPAIGLSQPILGTGGQAQMTGQPALPDFIQSPMDFLTAKDIDLFANGPARLFDYAAAPIAVGLKGLGISPQNGATDTEVPGQFPFQLQGSYWAWLRSSTKEQRLQMAKFQTERTAGTVRNAYLRDELANTFERDYQMLDGLSSGDIRADYIAKHRLQVEGQGIPMWTDPVTGRQEPIPGSWLTDFETSVPVFGTQLAQWLDPIDPKTEEQWRAMDPQERIERLQGAGIYAMAGELLVTLPLFNGLGAVINLAKGGGFATVAARYAATAKYAEQVGKVGKVGADLYTATLRTTNGIMATGLTIATANWALSAASPWYSETLGEEIDSSRVVSNSAVAGIVNTTGFFTGFYGIETAIPAWFRAARGQGLLSQTAGYLRYGPRVSVPGGGHPADLAFHREMGGTKLGNVLEEQYDLPHELQGTALSTEFIQMTMRAEDQQLVRAFPRVAAGGQSGIAWIDDLPSMEERVAAIETTLARTVGHMHAQAALIGEAVNARNLDGGVNPGARNRKLFANIRNNARRIDDEATVFLLEHYGPRFFPQAVKGADGLEALAQKYLRGLGRPDDLAGLRSFAGKNVNAWHQVNRRLHQILFYTRNAEMHAAAAGSHEAGRIGIVSQRHLFADEVEDIANALADGTDPAAGQRLMHELIATKDDVQLLEAQGAFHTPEELAARLIQIAPTLPTRRQVTATSADGKLNDLQRVMDAEGLWSIGYKPTGRWTLPEGWVTSEVRPPEGYVRKALSADDLRAMGYRPMLGGEVMRGTEFSKRDPIWPIAEYGGGTWVREIPGEQISFGRQSSAPAAPAAPSDAVLARELEVLADNATWHDYYATYDEPPSPWEMDPVLRADGTPVVKSGSNPGANWPVLQDADGNRWIFKAMRGEPLTDLPQYRRLAAPTMGKLMRFLHIPTVQEYPYVYDGVRGTLQQMVEQADGVALDAKSLSSYVDPNHIDYNPAYIVAMQENQLVDWFLAQDDTNAGSFIASTWSGGKPMAIDKGRAFAYMGRPPEQAAWNDLTGASFWTWRSPQALDKHLGEYLLEWTRGSGTILPRQAVERVLQKIESIPEAEFRQWLTPIAEAREELGLQTADEFLDLMWSRRNGLREQVNRAYKYIGGYALPEPGKPIEFQPDQFGEYMVDPTDPVPVNSMPVNPSFLPFSEPELPPAPRYKAGVVIEEADGRIWVVDPKNQWGGHVSTFPKGGVEMSDMLNYPAGQAPDEKSIVRMAAAREAKEETGFSVEITGHLVDHTDDVSGTVTRYYTARRTGGGPAFVETPKEIENIVLLDAQQAKARLQSIDPNTAEVLPDEREQAILDAYMNYRWPQAPDPVAAPVDPLGSDPAMPGDSGLAPDEDYISYVKFENGTVFRSPWLDYPMSVPEHVEMGNRSVFMQKFDSVFRGWRTYRLGETQRASMHRRLGKLDIGLTPARIDALHAEILSAASDFNVPPQAFVQARGWMPFAKGAYDKLDEIVVKYLGKGPYLNRDGTVANIDMRHELSRAYQTSYKLNLTAGLTSRFYATGGLGAAGSFTAHVIYPALRFGLSPFFKAGEWVESWMLNALRGVNPFGGDPFTEQLMFEAGINRQRGAIRAELSSEPMLQGMTSAFDIGGDRPQPPTNLWMTAGVPEGLLRNRTDALAAGPPRERGLLETLYDHPVENSDIYPPTYPDIGAEVLVPHPGQDEAGNYLLDFDGRARDDVIIGKRFQDWLGKRVSAATLAQDPMVALHEFGAGMAFVDSLPKDFIDRLTSAITPTHMTSEAGAGPLANLRRNLEEGAMPAAGWPGRNRSDVEGKLIHGGETASAGAVNPSRNVSPSERAMAHVDAVYAGFGQWEGSSGVAGLIFKADQWKRSIITTHDRMDVLRTGPSVAMDDILTPEGGYRALRQAIFKELHSIGTGKSSFTGGDLAEHGWHEFDAMSPIEVAVPGGVDWDGIEAIMLMDRDLAEWADLVATYGDQVPALRDIKVVPMVNAGGQERSVKQTLVSYWFEKAGLGDARMIDNPREWVKAPVGAYARYIPSEIVTPETAPDIIRALRGSAASPDLLASLGAVTEEGAQRWQLATNFEDDLRRIVAAQLKDVKRIRAEREYATLVPNQSEALANEKMKDLDEGALRAAKWQELLRDVEEWRGSATGRAFDSVLDAQEALGGPKDVEAQAWLAGWHELYNVRFEALGGVNNFTIMRHTDFRFPQPVETTGFRATTQVTPLQEYLHSRTSTGIYDRLGDEMVAELPPIGDVAAPGDTAFASQEVAYAKWLVERFNQIRHPGYRYDADYNWSSFVEPGSNRTVLDETIQGDLRTALVEAARAKGIDSQPVINVWIRGNREQLQTSGTGGEVVITVMGVDGKPYAGLGLDEIADLWDRHGWPTKQSDAIDAAGNLPERVMDKSGVKSVWTPDGGPHGSLVAYAMNNSDDIGFAAMADGRKTMVDETLPPERYLPITFAYNFEPAGNKNFVLLGQVNQGNPLAWKQLGTVERAIQEYSPFLSPTNTYGDYNATLIYKDVGAGKTHPGWSYFHRDGGSYREVQIGDGAVVSLADADELLDDLLVRMELEKSVNIGVGVNNEPIFQSLYQRMTRGDLPDTWVIQKAGKSWDTSGGLANYWGGAMGPDDWKRYMGVPEEAIAMTPEPTPASLDEVVGGPEHLTASLVKRWSDEIAKAGGKTKERLREGFDAYWNPVPAKERQQDKLIQSIVREWYPDMLRQFIPDMYDFMRTTAKVPEGEFVTYLAQDRKLLDAWLASGSRTDFDKLVMHAEQYTGKAAAAKAREELNTLYTTGAWTDMMSVLQMTMKTAQDEAFGVHFFNPYRSSFERTINHPLLGVYPASWAYKVAKEWFRFLYDNDMFSGFRLGMAPAQYIAHLQRQQAVAFAQMGGEDLSKWEQDGPLGSTIFIFNLLLPGDWSALPFPLSRSIRDALRGNLNPYDHFQKNLTSMGLGRDVRLINEVGNEWLDLATGEQPALQQGEEQWAPVAR